MEKVVNFQVSLFGSFVNIQPNNEITMRLINNLREFNFVPGIANVSTVDTENKKVVSENRLQMVTQNGEWLIVFFQERIDFNYNYLGGDTIYSNLDDIFMIASNMVSKTFSTFADTKGCRMAVNGRFLLKSMTIEEKASFVKRFSTPFSVFGKNDIIEWNVHFNSLGPMTVKENIIEKCNNIIEIGDIIGINTNDKKTENRMAVVIDVNTDPHNFEFRFKYNDLLKFMESAKPFMHKALEEIGN